MTRFVQIVLFHTLLAAVGPWARTADKNAGMTTGIGLAPLATLPVTEWISLHFGDITEADLEHLKGLTKLRRLGLANMRLTAVGLNRLPCG